MPTATIEVASVTSPDQWVVYGSGDKVTAVNSPDDDIASAIYPPVNGHEERYSLGSHGIPPGSVINSVTARTRGAGFGGTLCTYHVNLYLGGNTSNGPVNAVPGGWSDFLDTIARPGGGSWSLTDLTSLQVGLVCDVTQPGITSLWLLIDYSSAPPPSNTGKFFRLFR